MPFFDNETKRENLTRVIDDVIGERYRQEKLKEDGKFLFTCASPSYSDLAKFAVLGEEYGEVAKEVVEMGITVDKYQAENAVMPPHRTLHYLERIRKALIQIAAVCVAWCEALDRKIEALK